MAFLGVSWNVTSFQSQRYMSRFLANFSRYRCHFLYYSSSISAQDVSLNHLEESLLISEEKNECTVDEHYVLNELSEILSLAGNSSVPKPFKVNRTEKATTIGAVDGYLLPEEKLRGVFLQKLKGKTAIEHALACAAGVDLSLDVVSKVLNKGSLGGEAMVTFFNWAIKQPSISKDTNTYHIILKALGRRKFFKFMREILNDMRRERVIANTETLSIAIDSFLRDHQISKALQVFNNLEEIGLKCDTESFNILLQCLCQRSHVGAASSLMNSMKGKVPFNCMTYNIIIGGWSRYGRVGEIEKHLKEMEANGFHPGTLTYTYLLEGLGRTGLILDAVETFDKMRERDCIPDVGTYNAMISNFISIGDFDESMKYYKQMLRSSCDPNINTYIKLITGLIKTRKVADALELFDEMLERGVLPNTGTITSFIELLSGFGPPHAAMMIYKKARKAGCRISESAYKLLLMRLSRFGKCGMLLNLWDEMQECGYSMDVEAYEYVINGLCNIGHLENAVLVMEECLRKGFCPSRLICSKLNHKLMDSERVEMAYKLFLKIKDARRVESLQRFWRANGWHF